jgi:phosphoribosylformylglycinamidine cyclo-ligase
VFEWLQRTGDVAEDEMFRVFNCGIGMVVVLDAAQAKAAADQLRQSGETVYEIGRIDTGAGEPAAVIT